MTTCLQLLLRVGTLCSFFQAVLVQEERPVQHAGCIVVYHVLLLSGFLQFSAILVPGIAAQSSLDTKEKDILCVILRLEIIRTFYLTLVATEKKMHHCKTRVGTTFICVKSE